MRTGVYIYIYIYVYVYHQYFLGLLGILLLLYLYLPTVGRCRHSFLIGGQMTYLMISMMLELADQIVMQRQRETRTRTSRLSNDEHRNMTGPEDSESGTHQPTITSIIGPESVLIVKECVIAKQQSASSCPETP